MRKKIIRIALVDIFMLLIPLIVMQFTDGVKWTLFDFFFMGIFLFVFIFLHQIAIQNNKNITYKAGLGLAFLSIFLLVWINGAVGIIGSENNPANLIYFGVIATFLIGVIVARLDSSKMARALFITAITQALASLAAFVIWGTEFFPNIVSVFVLNFFFVLMFIGSALLFQNAVVKT